MGIGVATRKDNPKSRAQGSHSNESLHQKPRLRPRHISSIAYGADSLAQMSPKKCVAGFKLFNLPILFPYDG